MVRRVRRPVRLAVSAEATGAAAQAEVRPVEDAGRCGRFAARPGPGITRRRCDRCDVTWQGHGTVKFIDTVTDDIWQAWCQTNEAWGRMYFMRASLRALPGEIEWDQFDEFIDHSRAHVPSPA